MSVLSGFNRVLEQFLTELVQTFPDLTDLRTIKTGVELLKKANPRAVLDQFMLYISPYYIQIYNKKESFFQDMKNIMDHPEMQKKGEETQTHYFQKIALLNDVWGDLTDHNKEIIWKYFHSLLKLGSIASKNADHKKILSYLKNNPELF